MKEYHNHFAGTNNIQIGQNYGNIVNNILDNSDIDNTRINDILKNLKKGKIKDALELLIDLKKELWRNADSQTKWYLLAQIGMLNLGMDKISEGASQLIQAKQYNSEDEMALALAARGHLLLNQNEKAEKLIEKVLDKNPANTIAHALRIEMASEKESVENLLNQVPEHCQNHPDILLSSAEFVLKQKKYLKAEELIQLAINSASGYTNNLKVNLATVILDRILEKSPLALVMSLSEEDKGSIEKAICLLTEFLQNTPNDASKLSPLEIIALQNRSGAYWLLGKYNDAIRDIELVLQIQPNDSYLIKQRAFLAEEINNYQEAYQWFQKIISNPDVPEATILAINSLIQLKDFDKAQTILNDYQITDVDEQLKQKVKRLQAQIYIAQKDYQNANNVIDSLLEEEKDPLNYVIKISFERQKNKDGVSNELVNKAKESLKSNPSSLASLLLAEELYFSQYYADAAEIYESFVDTSLNSPETYKLVHSYDSSRNYRKALEICEKLLSKYGALEPFSQLAAYIHQRIENLSESKKLYEDYLEKYHDDEIVRLRLVKINYLEKNYGDVDKYLKTKPNIDNLQQLDVCYELASLYKARNFKQQFLDTIYEIRRKFDDRNEVHAKFWFETQEIESIYSKLQVVENNCGVLIEYENGDRQWYILENKQNTKEILKELNSQDELYKIILGKKRGEIINANTKYWGKQVIKILAITNKYFAAMKISLNRSRNNPSKYLQEVVGTTEELTNQIQKILQDKEDNFVRLNELYKQGKISFGRFANALRQNPIDLWFNLVTRDDSLIYTWSDFKYETFEDSLTALQKGGLVIIDPISLMTLHQLNIADEVVKAVDNFGISRSTLDVFELMVENTRDIESQGTSSLGMNDDETIYLKEFGLETVLQKQKYFENIVQWIKVNCEILPCWRALDINANMKDKLDEVFHVAFINTVLIAGESGRILYSDDQYLRWYGNIESGVKGVWTQVVLRYCLENNYISEEKYHQAVLKLVCLDYYHTNIESSTLLEAVKQSKWKVNHPYAKVLDIIRNPTININKAISIFCEFAILLYEGEIIFTSTNPKDELIFAFLKALTQRRSRLTITNKLLGIFFTKPLIYTPTHQKIINLINSWNQGYKIIN